MAHPVITLRRQDDVWIVAENGALCAACAGQELAENYVRDKIEHYRRAGRLVELCVESGASLGRTLFPAFRRRRRVLRR